MLQNIHQNEVLGTSSWCRVGPFEKMWDSLKAIALLNGGILQQKQTEGQLEERGRQREETSRQRAKRRVNRNDLLASHD